jgi:methionine synthase II (cobalamin-independent)
MFTVTADLTLPSTVTGSWPRPRWFDVSMWGQPLDTCMMDVRFREKFQDALAVVISEQERAGLDIISHGDFHCDEDMAGRSWHHYPLQRWAGLEGDYLQSEATRQQFLKYPPGTLLNEIYTGWRWPRVVDKIEHRPFDYPKIWRMCQARSSKPVKFGTVCSQVMSFFLDIHTTKYKDIRQVIWDMAESMNTELLALRDAGCQCIQTDSAKRCARITQRIGQQRLAEREARSAEFAARTLPEQKRGVPADAPANVWDARVAGVIIDGGRMQVRDSRWGTAKELGERRNWWREPKIACVTTFQSRESAEDPLPEVPASLLDPLFVIPRVLEMNRARVGTGSDAKACAASGAIASVSPPCKPERWSPPPLVQSVVGTLGSYEDLGRLAEVEAWHRGFAAAQGVSRGSPAGQLARAA